MAGEALAGRHVAGGVAEALCGRAAAAGVVEVAAVDARRVLAQGAEAAAFGLVAEAAIGAHLARLTGRALEALGGHCAGADRVGAAVEGRGRRVVLRRRVRMGGRVGRRWSMGGRPVGKRGRGAVGKRGRVVKHEGRRLPVGWRVVDGVERWGAVRRRMMCDMGRGGMLCGRMGSWHFRRRGVLGVGDWQLEGEDEDQTACQHAKGRH